MVALQSLMASFAVEFDGALVSRDRFGSFGGDEFGFCKLSVVPAPYRTHARRNHDEDRWIMRTLRVIDKCLPGGVA